MNKKEMALIKRKKMLLGKMANLSDFIRGSVVISKKPCTYKGCKKCKSGERHPNIYLSISKHGKTHTVYVSSKRERDFRKKVNEYRRLKNLMEEISDINLKLLILKVKDKRPKKSKNHKNKES